jgi:ferredoxin
MIVIDIKDRGGQHQAVEVPEDINLSLMEILKAMEYPISGTCGGLALCATCHIEVLKGRDQLPQPQEAELQMIDSLPDVLPGSRLSCQLRLNAIKNGMAFRIMPVQ